MLSLKQLVAVGKNAIGVFLKNEGMNLAAALAYYAVFSLFPILLLIISALSFFLESSAAQASVVTSLSGYLPGLADLIRTAIDQAVRARGAVTVIGIIGLIWSGSNVFTSMESFIAKMWGVQKQRGFLWSRVLAFLLVAGSALLMLATLAISALITYLESTTTSFLSFIPEMGLLWRSAEIIVSLLIIAVVFAILYRYIPNTEVAFADVWLGALLAAVLWEISKEAFAFYLGTFANFNATYGSVGTVLAMMMWLWITALLVLLGAALSAEYAKIRRAALRREEAPRRWVPHKEPLLLGGTVYEGAKPGRAGDYAKVLTVAALLAVITYIGKRAFDLLNAAKAGDEAKYRQVSRR